MVMQIKLVVVVVVAETCKQSGSHHAIVTLERGHACSQRDLPKSARYLLKQFIGERCPSKCLLTQLKP